MENQVETKVVSLEECLTNADVQVYVIEKGMNYSTGECQTGFYVDASSDMNHEMAKQDFDSLTDAFDFLKAHNVHSFEVRPYYTLVYEYDE